MGSQQKKKKRTEDTRSLTSEIKRTQDQDVNKLALQPIFELGYSPVGAGTTSYVNVSTSITYSLQTNAPTPPGLPTQVLGLTVTVIGNNQLNLAWTASTLPDHINYKVYRSLGSGFIVDSSNLIASPASNSYPDTGVLAGTTYYYKVSDVGTVGEGPPSAQGSGTTTGTTPAPTPSLELHLNSSFADTSPNLFAIGASNGNGFILPGAFGTAGWKCNSPTAGFDVISPESGTNPYPIPLKMDTTAGFSVSLWINPQNLSALSFRRVLWEYPLDANNKWSIQIEGGTAYFFVKKGSTDYKAEVSGFTTGSWQHIAATFNGATNSALIYRNAVAGTSSTATPQYPYVPANANGYMMIGYRASGSPGTDGSDSNTLYVGYYDEIRYYKSVVLTPTQITNLKNTNAP